MKTYSWGHNYITYLGGMPQNQGDTSLIGKNKHTKFEFTGNLGIIMFDSYPIIQKGLHNGTA